jgi:hypothetical protein
MNYRLLSTLFTTALCLTVSRAIALPPPAAPMLVAQTQAQPPTPSEPAITFNPSWIIALSTIAMAIAALGAATQYYEQQRWKRVEFVRNIIKEFENKPSISYVLSIIDFEEFRKLPLELPGRSDVIFFEPRDRRLRNALVSHDESLERKRAVERLKEQDPNLYKQEIKEYMIELTLRSWFDDFLNGLSYFEYYIKSKLITADELRPYIIYWIRLIGDREYRREGASGFYEQLFTYIHDADYTDVQKLFERYGYRILPTPYRPTDFDTSFTEMEAKRALTLGKVSYLVYSDERYIREIITLWQNHGAGSGAGLPQDAIYIDEPESETQGILFRINGNIVLGFRGTQKLRDWQTNIKIKFRKFASKSKLETMDTEIVSFLKTEQVFRDNARVHRGFQHAWDTVATKVTSTVVLWLRAEPNAKLWVTGHSLGGALATIAAASLQDKGIRVDGLYTFGQPRVGNWAFQRQFDRALGDHTFRYVNNNDIVPAVPPPILPWTFPRIYRHVGHKYYFDVQGNLTKNPDIATRLFDGLLGYLIGTVEQGFDGINDHRMEMYVAHLQKVRASEKVTEQVRQEDEDDQRSA